MLCLSCVTRRIAVTRHGFGGYATEGLRGPRNGKFGVKRYCLGEQRLRFILIFPTVAWQGSKSSEVVIVGLEVPDLARSACNRCFCNGRRNLSDDATGNLILQFEHVLKCAIETIRPYARARVGVDE